MKKAAIDLALELGPEQVTVEQIAQQAHVSVRTFFNYFASKEDAWLGAPQLEPDEAAVQEFMAGNSGGRIFEDLRTLVLTLFAETTSDEAMYEKRLRLLSRNRQLAALQMARLTEFNEHLVDLVAQRITRETGGGSEERLSSDQARLEAQALVSLCSTAIQLMVQRAWGSSAPGSPAGSLAASFDLLATVAEKYLVSAPATAVPITATHNSGAALEARQLTRAYGSGEARFMALRDVSLTVHQGESLAIIGKSGSGKSTLMHLLALLDTPTNGTVMVGGTNASTLSTAQLNRLRNRAFGFVFQQFYLIPGTSVLDNVTLPLKIRGVPPAERKRLGLEVLEQVELLDKASNRATDLSGGQKQRTVIARALINQPKVIFADEPTGNLDSATGDVIMDLLFSLNEQHGITLVVVTHDEDLARRCGRSLTIMDGTIVNPQTTGEAEEVAFG